MFLDVPGRTTMYGKVLLRALLPRVGNLHLVGLQKIILIIFFLLASSLFSSLHSGPGLSIFTSFHPSFLSRVLVVPVSVTATLPPFATLPVCDQLRTCRIGISVLPPKIGDLLT